MFLEKETLKLKPEGKQELANVGDTFINAQTQENHWSWRLRFWSTYELWHQEQTSLCQ